MSVAGRWGALAGRLDRLTVRARVVLVLGGYALALLLALLMLVAWLNFTEGPDRDASSGMVAFADAGFLVVVIAGFSVVPSSLMLYFLRTVAVPWWLFALLGVAVALTGIPAVWSVVRATGAPALESAIGPWALLAVPRVLVAPVLFGMFLLIAAFAPQRRPRAWLLCAAALEGAYAVFVAIHWFVPLMFP